MLTITNLMATFVHDLLLFQVKYVLTLIMAVV